jgi:tetratricopeptide (TPR) repeat protein
MEIAGRYNSIVARWFWILAFAVHALWAQKPELQEPPEEDTAHVEQPKEYAFNPLQAEKEVRIGSFYMKKGSWKAAILRFREATKWNPGMADAWLHLGEALEKSKDMTGAKAAYARYVALAPDAKNTPAIRKKL